MCGNVEEVVDATGITTYPKYLVLQVLKLSWRLIRKLAFSKDETNGARGAPDRPAASHVRIGYRSFGAGRGTDRG
jgi:hypothetical protein